MKVARWVLVLDEWQQQEVCVNGVFCYREMVVFGGLIDGTFQPAAAAAGDYSDEAQGEALGESPADARQATRCRAQRRRVKETINRVYHDLSQHHTTFAAALQTFSADNRIITKTIIVFITPQRLTREFELETRARAPTAPK